MFGTVGDGEGNQSAGSPSVGAYEDMAGRVQPYRRRARAQVVAKAKGWSLDRTRLPETMGRSDQGADLAAMWRRLCRRGRRRRECILRRTRAENLLRQTDSGCVQTPVT